MRVMKTVLYCAAFAIGAATSAHANIVTYDFSVTDSSNVVHDGSFSFDSSTIVNGLAPGRDLTSLSFNWNGIAYSTANANDGFILFANNGQPFAGCIGDDLFSGGCQTIPGATNDWFFSIGANSMDGSLDANTGCGPSGRCSASGPTGPITTQVPEPGILTLLGIALAGAGLVVRKRHTRA